MNPFYIEADEEITSVIDRLRLSTQNKVIFVVPAGAMLLQSAVNLRILAREAQKEGKELVIVTSDEYGQILAQKIGVETYANLDEIEGLFIEDTDGNDRTDHDNVVDNIGSTTYYETGDTQCDIDNGAADDSDNNHKADKVIGSLAYNDSAIQEDQFAHSRVQNSTQNYRHMQQGPSMDVRRHVQTPITTATQEESSLQKDVRQTQHTMQPADNHDITVLRRGVETLDAHKKREVQEFFGRARERTQEVSPKNVSSQEGVKQKGGSSFAPRHDISAYTRMSSRDVQSGQGMSRWKKITLSALAVLVVSFVVSSIIFLPRVTVTLKPVVHESSATLHIVADATQAATVFDERKIGALVIEKEMEKTITAKATGTSTAGSYKARGAVTIYNMYSNKPQKLVATTRLLAENGVLFRLIESVTVPGMKKDENGKLVPGSVTATVIADKAGEASNIGPTTFTIPGFKGTPRYTKFYAQSNTPMVGGSTEGGTQTVVTRDDIEHAKKKAEDEVTSEVKEYLMKDARAQGKKLLDDAIRVEIVSSGSQVVEGVAATSFDYTVHVRAQGIIFSEDDITLMIKNAIKNNVQEEDFEIGDINIAYNSTIADFDKRRLEFDAHGTARVIPRIDTDEIRDALVGVKKSKINETLAQFSGIEQAELNYNLGFLIGRLPWYKKSIKVVVER